ncbi:MAG: alpha-2-macroglobulin family protein [Bryobacteraceae bacterium]
MMRSASISWFRAARLLLLLAAAAPGLSQGEKEPYFALSTNRTFGPSAKPSVSVSSWNVDLLEFRVYRLDDPVQFFQQIEDAHRFGGRAPAPPHEPTLLERIHSWKSGLRANIRRSLRAQFTEPPSNHIAGMKHAAPPVAAYQGTQFAVAPVLNSQQLVLKFVQPVQGQSRWQSEIVPVGVKDKGFYLVEAVHGDLRAYTLLMISDIALITKTGKNRVINLVVNRSTGEPVAGAKVWTMARDKALGEATTNSDGVAELPIKDERPSDIRVMGRSGADYAVNALGNYSFQGNTPEWMGYVYTDRPVYRPGHTVHFKTILRLRGAAGFEVPAGKQVSVEIDDAEQKPVYQKMLTASASGAIHDDLALAPGAALGDYYIQVKAGDSMMGGNFQVEEYKKPEYEVRVLPARGRVLQGEKVQVTIDTRYYFGEPVSGAKVQYAVYRDRYYFPLWYDPYEDSSFAPPDQSDDSNPGDQLDQGEGELDADGKLNIEVETSVSDHKWDYMYRVEARVTDQARREITGRGWILATYGSFALNIRPERYFYRPGEKAALIVEARDYDNKPVATRAHVELLAWDRHKHKETDLKASTDLTIGADGEGTASLDMPQQGDTYRVRVTARTPEGREIEDYSYVWVSGGGFDFESGQDQAIPIVPDKKQYRAGDTAKLLIVTGKPNTPVYVAVEGRDLREWRLVRSADSTATFEIPVTAQDEPGISVSAGFVRKGTYYAGTKYLRVPPAEHQLNVKVATDKPQYLPGQTAEYSIDVTGNDGKPVPRAEFSLGVVDEAIYAIVKDTTQDPIEFFFGNTWNVVSTEISLDYYFTGEAGKRRMRLAELRAPSRLAQLKPDRLVQPKVRKAFPDTAFWATDLVTDAAGHARAKVEFPDSLTTWRATARGATPDTKVGSATLKTIVRKNLILRLAVPRFFVQGDEVVISALVHNYLPNAKTARVSLDVKGLDLLEGATKDVAIPSRGEAKVDWRVRAQKVRGATLTGKALTDEESDALELDLPIGVPGVKLSESRGGALAPSGAGTSGASAAFDLTFPEKLEAGSRSLSIRLAPSIAGSLFGALEYLTSYPYGCVEQTMSSFLPDIVVTDAIRNLGVKTVLDEASLADKVRDGLDRLYNFQHEDGGWGWWETDESHPFMTAYVVAGLVQAKAAGVQVKPEVIDKGVAWLAKAIRADSGLAGDLRAYMAYALTVAGKPDAAALTAIYQARAKLSPYGLALLGLALEQVKDARASEIAAALEQAVQQNPDEAWWPATRDDLLDFSEDATPEATAYVVKFLSHQRADSALLPKAALWLMNHRNEGYWWTSTKQTAMVIYGLADYLKATHELNPDLNVTVSINGGPPVARKLDQDSIAAPAELLLDDSKLQPGVNHLRISAAGAGRLYYSARIEYYSTERKLQNNGTISLNILRDYFKLTPAKDGDKIVYEAAPLNGPVASGDTLAVRLTVTGSEWKYLMIEDPIPAGTEFIERDNLYQFKERPPWWHYFFTRRELHDDRMAIFQTYFAQGQKEYFYLLKVVNPGTFQISPARAVPMYNHNVMATTDSRRLEVK